MSDIDDNWELKDFEQDDTFYGLEHEIDGVRIGDIQVLGRPLRSYTPTEFASLDECDAFQGAVYDAVPVGQAFCNIISQEFHDTFHARRVEFINEDTRQDNIRRITQNAKILLGDAGKVEVVKVIEIAHLGWESDNLYALVRTDAGLTWVGTDHGSPRQFDTDHIKSCLEKLEQQAAAIREALALTQ